MGDSGAECTTISLSMAERSGIKVETLNKPVMIELASSDHKVEVIGKSNVTLEINTNVNGIITVRQTPILIMKNDMSEVLLGEDLLKRLGIDVAHLLIEKGGTDINYNDVDNMASIPHFGGDSKEKIMKILQAKMAEVDDDNFGEAEARKLKEILYAHLDELRTIMDHDPLIDLPAYNPKWDPDKASKVKPRRMNYTREQKQFLDYFVGELLSKGYAYENNRARYASEVLVVPKCKNPTDFKEDYRMVINLKAANAATEPMQWPFPTMEDVQQYLTGAKYFITLDCKNGFWQIKVHEDSQELFSFATHRQTITPVRLSQGAVDASGYFTWCIHEIYKERIYNGLLPWIDDLLLYAKTIDELLELLEWVLQRAKDYGLKFSPKKLSLMAKEKAWCGKLITPDGIKPDPEKIKALMEMPLPRLADELMQYYHAANWLRSHIPEFTKHFSGLNAWVNLLLSSKGSGKRTKRRAHNIQLVWTDDMKRLWEISKEKIAEACMNGHPDPLATFILFADACDFFWSGILVQVFDYDPDKDISDQNMQVLFFLSGAFIGSQLNWSTPEQEAYAIIACIERLEQILIRPKGFIIYTDHNNLLFTYGIYRTQKINTRLRMDRWALKLQSFRYSIHHIAGERNVWADLLSRWGANQTNKGEKPTATSVKRIAVKKHRQPYERNGPHVARPRIRPLENLNWPHLNEIRDQQLSSGFSLPAKNMSARNDLVYFKDRLWIPNTKQLRVRLLLIAHYGISGHSSIADTTRKLREHCDWQDLDQDVRDLIQDCIICRCAKQSSPAQHHRGERSRPTKPNQALHFDYYFVGESNDGSTYVLMLRDGFSRFTMLFDHDTPSSENAVESLLTWISLFGVPDYFFSDNGSHFRNKIVKELCRRLNIEQRFSTAYCGWSNGQAERVMRDIHQLLLVFVHDQVDRLEWPRVLKTVMFTVNQRPSRVLNGHTPLKIHTGQDPTNNQLDFIFTDHKFTDLVFSEEVDTYFAQLNDTLDELHQETFNATAKVNRSMRKDEEALPQFEIGDYVLYSFIDRPRKEGKLYFTWMGPFQVVATKSDYVYIIKDLVNERHLDAHVTRMSFYSNSQLNVTGELLDLISRQGLEYDIQELVDLKWNPDRKSFVVRTSWLGFSENEDTWEPFQSLLAQIPFMLLKFIDNFGQGNLTVFNKLWKVEKKNIVSVLRSKQYDFKKHFKIVNLERQC